MSDDLIGFLNARLDEEAELALSASPGPWHLNDERDTVIAVDDIEVTEAFALSNNQLLRTAEHIALWDPTRVLAEIDADRTLAAAYTEACRKRAAIADQHWGPAGPSGDVSAVDRWKEHDAAAEALKPHVMRRAATYANHPDYRPEWR